MPRCARPWVAPGAVGSMPIWAAAWIKQRIARKGGGRSSGFRTIVLFRRGELAFFV